MFSAYLKEKGEYGHKFDVNSYTVGVNHVELVCNNATHIKIIPMDRILELDLYLIPAESGAEG